MLIEGPAIFICDECIGCCIDILEEQAPHTLQRPRPPVTEKTETAVLNFLNDLRDPESLGHAVSAEVRQKARELSRQMLKELDTKLPG